MRTLTTVVAITALTGLAFAGAVTSASASDPNLGLVRTTTSSYLEPTRNGPIVHARLPADTTVHVRCTIKGQPVSGNSTWYRIGVHGEMGFVPAGTVYTDAKLPSCLAT
jgi:hypothetical protein